MTLLDDPNAGELEGLAITASGLDRSGPTLVPVERNPIDLIWEHQPEPPLAPVELHPNALAGELAKDKLPASIRTHTRLLAAWDFGAALYVLTSFLVITRLGPAELAKHAARHDVGRGAIALFGEQALA